MKHDFKQSHYEEAGHGVNNDRELGLNKDKIHELSKLSQLCLDDKSLGHGEGLSR